MSKTSKTIASVQTPTASAEPEERMVIDSLETLRVLSDPLRLQILELMSKPVTVKAVAKALQTPATKLYYHVGLMEEHGLIRVADTRVVSGIIEKQYQVTAKNFSVDRSLLEIHKTDASSLTEVLHNLMDGVGADIQKGLESGLIGVGDEHPVHKRLMLGRTLVKMAPAQAEDFAQKLTSLMKEYDASGSKDAQFYSLFIAFHPHSRAELKEDEDE